jgi:hypothetical protein
MSFPKRLIPNGKSSGLDNFRRPIPTQTASPCVLKLESVNDGHSDQAPLRDAFQAQCCISVFSIFVCLSICQPICLSVLESVFEFVLRITAHDPLFALAYPVFHHLHPRRLHLFSRRQIAIFLCKPIPDTQNLF